MSAPPKYPKHGSLRSDLNQAVDAYFADQGRARTGDARLLVKAIVIVAWAVASYVGMVFLAAAWWQVALCAVSLGFAVAGIGFSVMHDGGHGASSKRSLVNKIAARTNDMVGASSHAWAFKHNVIHHLYPNVEGVDDDIEAEPFLRMAQSQPRRWFHRWQHLYFPLAYAFLLLKWHFVDDFKVAITRRLGTVAVPALKKTQLAEMLAWKVFAFGWIFALPIAVHGVLWAVGTYLLWAGLSGVVLAIVFQLAHCVEEATFTAPPAGGERLEHTWAGQQLATTANFAPNNRLLTWYVGGLNHQIEHHLFPHMSHVHSTFHGALSSHRRHLKRMGERVVTGR
ncbi:MAG: fatty acid desaturase family protein [Planctomycetota bacterium]|jgi:linoleoyl-CoA desaturase